MSYLYNPKVQLAVLAVLLVAVVVSFLYGSANMLQNLIAEAVGIALGVWLTVTLVERLLERRHRARWEEVRSHVLRAMSYHIEDTVMECIRHVGSDYGFVRLPGEPIIADLEGADAMARTIEGMRKPDDVSKLQEMFRETEWHFRHFTDVYTLRLIELGDEPKLVELLMDIERHRTEWRDFLLTPWKELAPDQPFQVAKGTLQALNTLYRYLAQPYDG